MMSHAKSVILGPNLPIALLCAYKSGHYFSVLVAFRQVKSFVHDFDSHMAERIGAGDCTAHFARDIQIQSSRKWGDK